MLGSGVVRPGIADKNLFLIKHWLNFDQRQVKIDLSIVLGTLIFSVLSKLHNLLPLSTLKLDVMVSAYEGPRFETPKLNRILIFNEAPSEVRNHNIRWQHLYQIKDVSFQPD